MIWQRCNQICQNQTIWCSNKRNIKNRRTQTKTKILQFKKKCIMEVKLMLC